jgi:hypothetical protein
VSYQGVEGCVPYSAQNPDTYICGDVPDGFAPGLPQGTDQEYPNACQEAWEIYQRDRAEMKWAQASRTDCEVVPTARWPGRDPSEIDFYVIFKALTEEAENVSIPLNTG